MKNSVFSTFVCDPEIMLKWLQHYGNLREFYPEKNYGQVYFPQKKKFRQNGRFPILRPNLRPLSGIENFFSQNLTYSYNFLGWNSPGITMSLESLHNYFVITVKSRKNDEKIGLFDFCLWSRNNDEMIARSR